MDIPPNDELEEFLRKVDQIESVVKGISSDDNELVSQNLDKADKLIHSKDIEVEGIKTKTGVNRTCINKYTEQDGIVQPMVNPNNMSQDAFMAFLEKDANERYERKKQNTKKANEIKEKGNLEFQNKNYEKAIEYYTEALQIIRDIPAIYTNRAQAYIITGKYNEAIVDCDWALRVNDKCTKAMIHKAKALTHLKEFDKALEQFENAKKIDDKQIPLIDEYIKEMERYRLAYNQEKAAEIFLTTKEGNQNDSLNNFLEILEKKLVLEGQNIWYYAGGIRCLGSLCNDETKKTVFRTHNGFKLFDEHPSIKCYFNDEIKLKKLNASEIDLLTSSFELIQIVCKNCDENIRALFKINKVSNILENLFAQLKLNSNSSPIKALKLEILKVLLNFSQNEFGRLQILNNLNLNILIQFLIDVITNEKDMLVKEKSLIITQNFSLDAKFHSKITRENVKFITENFCNLIESDEKLSDILKSSALTSIYALTSQKIFLNVIMNCEKVWSILAKITEKILIPKENLNTLSSVVVCLLINICSSKTEFIEIYSEKIVENLIKASGFHNGQVLSLIGNILQNLNSRKKLFILFDKQFISNLVENIKSNNSISQSVKLLALCTQTEVSFREQLIDIDKSLNFFYEIFKNVSQTTVDQDISQLNNNTKNLNLKKLNEVVISNSVLCMSYCVETNLKLSQRLTKTNIMMDLLYLTRDGFNVDLQKNCGILIAKLAKADERHLNRLRELNGIEILYASLKNTNI